MPENRILKKTPLMGAFFNRLLPVLGCCLLLSVSSAQTADIILLNGKIFTSDTNRLYVDGLAIKGNRILATGASGDMKKLAGAKTRVIDLKGRTVVPGFNDAHHHAGANYPARFFSISEDINAPTPWETVRDSVANITRYLPTGTLIRAVINPALLEDARARRKGLDSVSPNHPVMLSAWTGHGTICNSAALKLLGYTEQTHFAGGRLERGADNRLTGLLEEYAGFRISRLLADKLPYAQVKLDIAEDYRSAIAFGITSDQVMSTGLSPQVFQKLFKENDFGPRVRIIAFPFTNSKQLEVQEWDKAYGKLNAKNYTSGIKMILDGTPLERGAYMQAAYPGTSGNHGFRNFSDGDLRAFLKHCLDRKQQVMVHAVGNGAVRNLIKAMRSLHPDEFWRSKRVRIEHGEFSVVDEKDFADLRSLGMVIVQNPLHLSTPTVLEEMKGFYSGKTNYLQGLRSYLAQRIPLAFGSDGPINPFLNIMVAAIHPNNPKEALSIEQAVMTYTLGSAYAEFKEKEKGSLRKGMLADLAVLSQDIFTIGLNQLPATESVLTIVDGKVVYEKGGGN
jgi:predicted amidohydrolase YtcJ